ncbi:MAG: hypothetical protein WC797_02835 [Candidatus Paceibacterota bacterium]|jgi:hypothetical protein
MKNNRAMFLIHLVVFVFASLCIFLKSEVFSSMIVVPSVVTAWDILLVLAIVVLPIVLWIVCGMAAVWFWAEYVANARANAKSGSFIAIPCHSLTSKILAGPVCLTAFVSSRLATFLEDRWLQKWAILNPGSMICRFASWWAKQVCLYPLSPEEVAAAVEKKKRQRRAEAEALVAMFGDLRGPSGPRDGSPGGQEPKES